MPDKFSSEKYDIILQGGQSNAEGCGMGPVDEEFVPDDDILYFNSDMSITRAEERCWDGNAVGDFSLSFAMQYKRAGLLDEGRKLLIIRSAVGGTGFVDKRWGIKDDLYLRMMEMVRATLALNPANRLITFLWHQGENDNGTPATIHSAHLSGLVNSVRGEFGLPNLPFIAADFVHEWKWANIAACEPTVNGIIDTCTDIGHGRFILTDTLLSNNEKHGNGDTIHFSRDALRILGLRYFEAYRAITGK